MSEEFENTEIAVPESVPTVPVGISAEERAGLIQEAQEARRQSSRLAEELHELRQLTLRTANIQQSQQGDPVDTALQALRQSNDPALVDALKPILIPILSELHEHRRGYQQLQAGLEQVAGMQRELSAHNKLAQAIPDIETLGPAILKELATFDQETREFYVRKPDQLRVLADKIRLQQGGSLAAKKVKEDRAKTGMDTGVADAQAISKAESLKKMSDKDFEREFENWISG